MSNRIIIGAFAPAVLALSIPALAQSGTGQAIGSRADPESIGEVIVTANRREERINRVAGSVVAVDQRALDAEDVHDFAGVARLTPGLSLAPVGEDTSFSRGTVAIRGITSTAGAATTGIYIDDTPIQVRTFGTSAFNVYPAFFDLARIEVLRGPQGTLFGAGAEGGVVRFITTPPDLNRLSGNAKAEIAFTESGAPSYEAGLAIDIPLVADVIAIRASGDFRRSGGWIDRVDYATRAVVDHDANRSNAGMGRVALLAVPADGLSITAAFQFQRTSQKDTGSFWEAISNPSKVEYANAFQNAQPYHDRFLLPSLKVQYDIGRSRLVSVTSYFDRRYGGVRDGADYVQAAFGQTGFPVFGPHSAPTYVANHQTSFSQEMRFESVGASRLRWTAGLFYGSSRLNLHERYIDTQFDRFVALGTAGAPFCPTEGCNSTELFGVPLLPDGGFFEGHTNDLDRQLAAFAQADYDILPRLTMTAGLRVAQLKFSFDSLVTGPFVGGPTPSAGRTTESATTPKLGLSYRLGDDTLLYASAAKGFRPGGAVLAPSDRCASDLAAIGLKEAPSTFEPDSTWSYEAGAKGSWFGGRVSARMSAFTIAWRNIQQELSLPTCGLSITANLGRASSRGGDLSLDLRPGGGLKIGAQLGYTDARYDRTVQGADAAPVVAKGDRLDVPRWAASLWAEETVRLSGREGYVRADYQYSSRGAPQDPRVASFDPGLVAFGAVRQLSMRLGTRAGGYDLSLFASNMTNDHPALSRGHAMAGADLYYVTTLRPRTVGITMTTGF